MDALSYVIEPRFGLSPFPRSVPYKARSGPNRAYHQRFSPFLNCYYNRLPFFTKLYTQHFLCRSFVILEGSLCFTRMVAATLGDRRTQSNERSYHILAIRVCHLFANLKSLFAPNIVLVNIFLRRSWSSFTGIHSRKATPYIISFWRSTSFLLDS